MTAEHWNASDLHSNNGLDHGLPFCLQRMAGVDQRAPPPLPRGASFEYRYMTEFQSHEPEFDYLKSLEIEEKINKVRWCRSSNNTRMLLSTNDKTVKLWKVGYISITSPSRLYMCQPAERQALGPMFACLPTATLIRLIPCLFRCMRRRCPALPTSIWKGAAEYLIHRSLTHWLGLLA